jgi:hypothetical protein
MSDDGKSFVPSAALAWRRAALAALWALVPTFGQMASAAAPAQVTLQVEAPHGLPGLHHSALARFIAAHMAEVRLYLNGEYQTLVEKQAIIQGGADDPDLAAAVASVTQSLLGPSGAYHAINAAHH